MKRVLLIVFAATILFACNTERMKQSTNAADQVPVEQENQEQIEGSIDDDDIPESMWIRNFYNGTLSGGGKTYNITMAISYPEQERSLAPLSVPTNIRDTMIQSLWKEIGLN